MDTKLFVRKQPGGLFSVIDKEFCTGSIFYVSSITGTDGAGYGRNPDAPLATLDYAVGLCTASAGDIIFLMPGHAESIAAATGAVLDIAGVTVIGLGRGSLIPKLSLITAAGATLSITAADCAVRNVHIYSNFSNGVTAGITIGADADGFVLDNIKMTEAANTKEFLVGILIAAGVTDGVIKGLKFSEVPGGSNTSAIQASGAADRLIIDDCYIQADSSAAVVKLDGAASVDVQFINNRVINIDTSAGLGVNFHASTTGMAANNRITNLKDNVAGLAGAAMAYHENYCSNALNKNGILVPGADS